MQLTYCNGVLHLPNGRKIRAVAGKNGLARDKKEGDLSSPIGIFPCRELWFRPDRVELPKNLQLPVRAITQNDGWCDDTTHADYNRHVRLPHPARHEKLWREDHAYDLMIPLGYNDAPPVPGLGSAIFFHLMHDDGRPTEGCIAISRGDMLALLPDITQDTMVEIKTD